MNSKALLCKCGYCPNPARSSQHLNTAHHLVLLDAMVVNELKTTEFHFWRARLKAEVYEKLTIPFQVEMQDESNVQGKLTNSHERRSSAQHPYCQSLRKASGQAS